MRTRSRKPFSVLKTPSAATTIEKTYIAREAARMTPPRKTHPRSPAASSRSSAMMISLLLREPGHEDVEALLESGRHADELTGACESGQPVDGAAHAVGDSIHPFGHDAHALDLVLRLARERPHVFRERMRLADERSQLLLDDGQHRLGAADRPPEREKDRDRRGGEHDHACHQDRLRPGLHGD